MWVHVIKPGHVIIPCRLYRQNLEHYHISHKHIGPHVSFWLPGTGVEQKSDWTIILMYQDGFWFFFCDNRCLQWNKNTGLHQKRAYTCLGIFCTQCVHHFDCFVLMHICISIVLWCTHWEPRHSMRTPKISGVSQWKVHAHPNLALMKWFYDAVFHMSFACFSGCNYVNQREEAFIWEVSWSSERTLAGRGLTGCCR